MADPRQMAPADRRKHLSPLMIAQSMATTGDKVNFCPFGCSDDQIDEHGYCRHLVGFTTDGKTYEPMKMNGSGRMYTSGKDPLPIQKGDQLIQITISSRVYRKEPEPAALAVRSV